MSRSSRPSRVGSTPGRSRAIRIALIAWWLAAGCGALAWIGLNSDHDFGIRAGTWLLGFAALGAVTGCGAGIGSLLADRGRILAGAVVLMAEPVVAVGFLTVMLTSTVYRRLDPLVAAWGITSALLLVVASLVILAPGEDIGLAGRPKDRSGRGVRSSR